MSSSAHVSPGGALVGHSQSNGHPERGGGGVDYNIPAQGRGLSRYASSHTIGKDAGQHRSLVCDAAGVAPRCRISRLVKANSMGRVALAIPSAMRPHLDSLSSLVSYEAMTNISSHLSTCGGLECYLGTSLTASPAGPS